MAVVMCIAWAVLFSLTLLALWKGLIFCSKPEDVVKDTMSSPLLGEKEKRARLPSEDAQHPHGHEVAATYQMNGQQQMQYAGEVPPMLYAGAGQQQYAGQGQQGYGQQQQYGHGMV